jgi:hypothetical protein
VHDCPELPYGSEEANGLETSEIGTSINSLAEFNKMTEILAMAEEILSPM